MATHARVPEQIRDLWDGVWSTTTPDHQSVLQDRFTIEAYRRLRKFVSAADRQILEAGCGTGRFCSLLSREFPCAKIMGVDASEQSVAMAVQLAGQISSAPPSFLKASVLSLPFGNDAFDLVFSQGLVSLFDPRGSPSDADALAEMVRVTRPGGRVLVSVSNWLCLPHTFFKWRLRRKGIHYEYGHETSYRKQELKRLLANAGLIDVQFSGFYPSYGCHRLSWRVRRFARTIRFLGSAIDTVDCDWLSRTFGFELMAVGTKLDRSDGPCGA